MEQKLSGGFENPKFILRSVAATSIAILIAGGSSYAWGTLLKS